MLPSGNSFASFRIADSKYTVKESSKYFIFPNAKKTFDKSFGDIF